MNKVEISHRIEEYFSKLGWTKAKFARSIGEYPQHLGKVFTGKLDPLKYIDKLIEIGCNRNWLLTGEKEGYIISEPMLKYSDEITKLKAIMWDMKQELEEIKKENYELRKDTERLRGENLKLSASLALVNNKGINGSVKKGGGS